MMRAESSSPSVDSNGLSTKIWNYNEETEKKQNDREKLYSVSEIARA